MSVSVTGPGSVGDHPRFKQLDRYLRDKAPNGLLPSRKHIDPIDLKSLLPFVNLMDVVRETERLRFRFRLVGTAQADALGADFTGRFVDEVFKERDVKPTVRAMLSVVSHGRPHYAEGFVPLPERAHIRYQRTVFPLASDGATVDMLIAAYVFLPDSGLIAPLRMVG